MTQTNNLILQTLSGNADRGGWQASASFANQQSLATYGRAAEIYVLAEGAGSWMPSYHLALSGTLFPSNVVFDRKQSNTSVLVSTADYFLSQAGIQGIYFSRQASPQAGNPHQATYWNLGLIVKHLLEEHTNITTFSNGWVDTSGIDIYNSTSVDVYTVRQTNSLWSKIADIASNEFYVRYFTKDDRFIYEPHPQFRTTIPDPVFTLTAGNIAAQPEIVYRTDQKVDQVHLYALSDVGNVMQAKWPYNAGTDARKQKYTNLRCNDINRLETLATRAYKFLNRDYDFRVTVAGAWGAFVELYDRVAVTYSGTATNGMSIAWTDKKFWISSVDVTINGKTATTEFMLEEELL